MLHPTSIESRASTQCRRGQLWFECDAIWMTCKSLETFFLLNTILFWQLQIDQYMSLAPTRISYFISVLNPINHFPHLIKCMGWWKFKNLEYTLPNEARERAWDNKMLYTFILIVDATPLAPLPFIFCQIVLRITPWQRLNTDILILWAIVLASKSSYAKLTIGSESILIWTCQLVSYEERSRI